MKNISDISQNIFGNISLVYDPERQELIHVDDAFAQFIGQDQDGITPEITLSIVHIDDRVYVENKFAELINGLLSGSVEFRVVVDDVLHWIRVTPFSLLSDGRNVVAANVVDITSEWNNFESIRRYANKKNSILNMLAHDLRGPLDIANTLTKSLNKKVNDPHLLKLTRSISGILHQSIEMIAGLIDRELLETVEVELAVKRLDIVKKIVEYIEECKRSEAAAERVFNLTSSHECIYLELDEAKFMQIMNNLVTNALKFTRPGGVISINIVDKGNLVLFTFSDNGIGIPESLHPGLFDKFTKARRKGLNGEPTIGLGLSIAKMIIEWHKGKIWVESQEQVGTTFFFEIPKIGKLAV